MRREAKYAFVAGVVILTGAIVWVVYNNVESEPIGNLPGDLASGVGPVEALAKPSDEAARDARRDTPRGAADGARHASDTPLIAAMPDANRAAPPRSPSAGEPSRDSFEHRPPAPSPGQDLPRVPQLVPDDDTGATPPALSPPATGPDAAPGSGTAPSPTPDGPSSVATPPIDPPPAAADRAGARPAAPSGPASYTVRKGDTLSAIAREHFGSEKHWPRIAAANPGMNPDVLREGQVITLPAVEVAAPPAASPSTAATDGARRPRSVEEPAPASPSGAAAAAPGAAGGSGVSRPPLTYVVGEGETLTQIARNALKDGGRWREIYELNRDKLSSPDVLIPGMVLRLPAGERSRGPERG